MGCGNSKDEQVMEDEENQNQKQKNMNNINTRKTKKMKNEKIKITEDPEKQGEKFHLDEKKGGDGKDNGEGDEEEDSFGDF